jgi:hypothetical protein
MVYFYAIWAFRPQREGASMRFLVCFVVATVAMAPAPALAGAAPSSCLHSNAMVSPGSGIGPIVLGMMIRPPTSPTAFGFASFSILLYVSGRPIAAIIRFVDPDDPAVDLGLQGYVIPGPWKHPAAPLLAVELNSRLFHAFPASIHPDALLACRTPTGVHLLSPWSDAVAAYPHAARATVPDGTVMLVDDAGGLAVGRGGPADDPVVSRILVFRPYQFCQAMRVIAASHGTDYTCTPGGW